MQPRKSSRYLPRILVFCLLIPSLLAMAGDSTADNLRTLAEMTPEQLYQLKEQKEKFERRSLAEQQRFRDLFQQLDARNDKVRLKQILYQYNQWLGRLSGEQRSRLAELPLEERIAEIKQIKQRQAIDELGFYGKTRLPEEDLPELKKWLDEFVERRQDDIIAISRENGPPPPAESREFPRNSRFVSQLARMALYRMDDQKRSKIFDRHEVDSLSSELSPEAQEVLKRALAEGNQSQLLRNWSRILWQPQTEYSEEDLQAFFENDLSDAQRSEMDQMTPDDRYNVLVGAYRLFKLNNREVGTDWDPKTFIRPRGFGGQGGRPQRPSQD